jgi:ketosteroid isomerase-like protein
MNEQKARFLFEAYFEGWKKNDLNLILSTLADDCIISESHGPTYHGLDHVRQWIENWFSEGSTVDRWDITSILITDSLALNTPDEDGVEGSDPVMAAAGEWIFECTVNGEPYRIEGITLMEFKQGKIAILREYRRTQPLFDWALPD